MNSGDTDAVIARLRKQRTQASHLPLLIPSERAAEILYGCKLWTRVLRNLRSAWESTLDTLLQTVQPIEEICEADLLYPVHGLPDLEEKRGQMQYVPALAMEVVAYDVDGDLWIDVASMIQSLSRAKTSPSRVENIVERLQRQIGSHPRAHEMVNQARSFLRRE